jgi:succinate dehydrogenase flavin-adding protein (antitoxin of CptAB toxin-antitoxin module)
VRRERDPADRRRVVVRLEAERGMRDLAPVFAPVVRAWGEAAAEYSDEQLSMILESQDRMERIMRDALAQLRDMPRS